MLELIGGANKIEVAQLIKDNTDSVVYAYGDKMPSTYCYFMDMETGDVDEFCNMVQETLFAENKNHFMIVIYTDSDDTNIINSMKECAAKIEAKGYTPIAIVMHE